jgi:hypothetical protein
MYTDHSKDNLRVAWGYMEEVQEDLPWLELGWVWNEQGQGYLSVIYNSY